MLSAWCNFVIVVLIQCFLFALLAHATRERTIVRTLGTGLLIGTMFGLSFDLIAGKLLGLHTYFLGFDFEFLVVNAILSYGLFCATVLLFRSLELVQLMPVALVVAAIYEIANLYLPVWQWSFSLPAPLFAAVLFIGYFGGASLVLLLGRTIRE